ncbi:MAG: glycoside hydrolase family 13 protein [Rubrivivax sp.]|nr:glycoside hydrolase family 13 protein [Rubrivivax sp.]
MKAARAGAVLALLLAACGPAVALAAADTTAGTAGPDCRPDPLQGRALYLRGTFNSWNALDTQRLTWACHRWQGVARLSGEHRFKIADEGWSADADFGGRGAGLSQAPLPLQLRGPEIARRFDGVHRFTLRMNDNQPELQIEACSNPAPLGDTVLFLRGTLNNWAALDNYAFQYSCDAYYLNLKASGRHEFKIADASWKDTSTVADGAGNFVHVFDGEHTLRLAWAGGKPQLSVGPRTFADPTAQAVTDPVALSLRFDSRALAHKSPFGALPAGSTVDYAVTALPGVERLTLVVETRRLEGNQELLQYSALARVPMTKAADGELERWTARFRYADIAVHGHWFEAVIGGKAYALQNNTDAVFWTREKGAGGRAAVADLPASAAALGTIRRFRQTVYDPAFQVPAWAPDIVYYYVFPERFRNGDARNDPKPGVDRYHQHTVEMHKSWNERPYRPGVIEGKSDGSDAHHNNDFFGGDLAGLIEKLDYIRELGANTIYMTPVFKASSNHKYDTADYREVDPAFGSNADFERLTREAAKRGLRVIPDTSLNHTGADSVYFNRYGNHGNHGAFQGGQVNPASPYAGWFSFDRTQADPDKQFKGWVGVTDLPELNKAHPGVRNFFYRDKDAVMKLWLDRGAAGWRMDVAPWVPDDFWREWRAAIKAHRPDALTVAETWFDASKYFLGDMFDSTMNYVFRNAVLEYAAGGDAAALYGHLEHLREAYPPQALHALMNLLSSHDQARALHHFGWHDDKAGDKPDPATIALAKRRLQLAVLFQMTYPGSPTVYYGDEVGVTGGDDPYNRATYPWADLGGQPDTALLAEFKKLIGLRNTHAVLRRGSLDAPLHADAHVLVLVRRLGDTWALTATNNAAMPRTVDLALPAGLPAAALRDVLGVEGQTAPAMVAGRLRLEVPALYGRVLITP